MGHEASKDGVSPIKTVLIDLDFGGSLDFPKEQIYDGTGASMQDFNAQDVIDSMKESGSKHAAAADWDLVDWNDVEINVTVIREDGSRTYAQW